MQFTYAQLTVTSGLSLTEYVQTIVGQGISVSNITYQGTNDQIGTFDGSTSNIGFNSGVVLAAGPVNGLVGPAANADAGQPGSGLSDPDLLTIAQWVTSNPNAGSISSTNDAAILEFDFVPSSNEASFNFVFSSDEYTTWINSAFNDVFAFFVSGPGITGPFASPPGFPGGAQNMAVVPGTNTPITISTIYPGGTPSGDSLGLNAQYYIDNTGGTTHTHNGFTVPISVQFNVICGETYHFKFAIADCQDDYLNTAVFLQGNSFFSYWGNSIYVFNDINETCSQDYQEYGVEGVSMIVDPGNVVGTSGPNGIAPFPSLVDGTYTITIDTTNINWTTTCPITQSFTITNGITDCMGFGLINDNPCTDPDVSIFAPSLRSCFSDRLVYVSACNQITATGILDSSYVDVELDPLLTLDNASLPYTDLGNNIFRFETGDIYPGQCVNFTISTTVSCNATAGQTLCMGATLYPAEACIFDSIPSDPVTDDGIGGTLDGLPEPCTLPWDQSSLQVEGWCQGDSVYFSVTNTGELGGGDMECYSPVWLTVDGVVTDTDSLQIQGGETLIYSYPASGQTFFLNAEQHPLHPGNSHPNAHVELCGDSTNWTPGGVNQFPQDDADPDVDIYCGQVTAPVDPNDKTGYPIGQTSENYIQPNQQLQYVVRFQNVGTDTAFNVIVRDTLDLDLNIFTVTPGVASHPYTFKMYGPRVLEWTFEDIQLPDSTTNEEASNGFLTFHVDQVPDLAPGTVINNDADITFDFELPITTNTTVHKIFEGFVEVLNIEDLTIEGKEI
ncbi:choice-of-anchor L domain-containing protein, partial [Crocinitomicaceae bacterium]|nr:choice-of-anchor L domain-containing protein [Crocinitomicaceae bacterium]